MSAAPHQYATKDANEFLPRCLLLLAAPWNITKYEYEKKKKGEKKSYQWLLLCVFLKHPFNQAKR